MQMVCSQEMHSIGYAWKTIKEQLGEEMENHINRMTFLKGKTVCAQNIYTNSVHWNFLYFLLFVFLQCKIYSSCYKTL